MKNKDKAIRKIEKEFYSLTQKQKDEIIIRTATVAATRSRFTDFDEAFSIALSGVSKGCVSYDPKKGASYGTFLYSCAKYELWAAWRSENRLKRGKGCITHSLEQLEEQGYEFTNTTSFIDSIEKEFEEWNET